MISEKKAAKIRNSFKRDLINIIRTVRPETVIITFIEEDTNFSVNIKSVRDQAGMAININIIAKMAINLDCSQGRVRSIYKIKNEEARFRRQK